MQATPLLGLQQLEEPGPVEVPSGLVCDATQILGCPSPLTQLRKQVIDAG